MLRVWARAGHGGPGSPLDRRSGEDRVSRQRRALRVGCQPGGASSRPDGRWRRRMAKDAGDTTHHHLGSCFCGPLLLSSALCRGRPAIPQCSAPDKSPEGSTSVKPVVEGTGHFRYSMVRYQRVGVARRARGGASEGWRSGDKLVITKIWSCFFFFFFFLFSL